MSRIHKAYELRFRYLLQTARARHLDEGVRWLMDKADHLATSEGISSATALGRVEDELVARAPFHAARRRAIPGRFYCDAGLGGLARWLRAAGYDADWKEGIADDDLLRASRENTGTVLTTDGGIMERRLVVDGTIPAFWLPPTLHAEQQLALVFCEFDLAVGEPRCMSCGGVLEPAEKEGLRERIPRKTYRWLDEYFVCRGCGKLFWRGTHWQRIGPVLNGLL